MSSRSFIGIIWVFLLVACDRNMLYDQFVHVEDASWDWSDIREFQVEVKDSLSLHNIYIQVRHTVDYPMSNLYMFVHVKSPEGQMRKDTIEMILARPDGEWTGRGNGHIRELSLLYRSGVRFALPGTYVFSLEQAMRKEQLPVSDLGIRVERINPS